MTKLVEELRCPPRDVSLHIQLFVVFELCGAVSGGLRADELCRRYHLKHDADRIFVDGVGYFKQHLPVSAHERLGSGSTDRASKLAAETISRRSFAESELFNTFSVGRRG
jgi:hypothetical protein